MMRPKTSRHWLGWIVLVLALVVGGWLVFDGAHGLLTGDYVTPASGRYAGQLGPWAQVVGAIGIEPRSILMKSVHVALGATWLLVVVAFAFRARWAWWGMIGCAVATLWYLPVGTLLSAVQIILLLLPPLRREASPPSGDQPIGGDAGLPRA